MDASLPPLWLELADALWPWLAVGLLIAVAEWRERRRVKRWWWE